MSVENLSNGSYKHSRDRDYKKLNLRSPINRFKLYCFSVSPVTGSVNYCDISCRAMRNYNFDKRNSSHVNGTWKTPETRDFVILEPVSHIEFQSFHKTVISMKYDDWKSETWSKLSRVGSIATKFSLCRSIFSEKHLPLFICVLQ